MRRRIGYWLRSLADRIDHAGAPKLTCWSFTFEDGEGIRWRQDRRGCPVAYLGDAEYARAHAESDSARTAEQRFNDGLSALARALLTNYADFAERVAKAIDGGAR